MVSLLATSGSSRLIGLGIVFNCFLFYVLFLRPAPQPELPYGPTPDSMPWFPSATYTEVVYSGYLWPYRVFKTSPATPPYMTVTTNGAPLAEGYLFLTPKHSTNRGLISEAPVIMRQDNELVYWMDARAGTDLRVQTVNGTPHLTVWQGAMRNGNGFGELVLYDDEYTRDSIQLKEAIVSGFEKTDGVMDFHEHEVTDRGTLLVAAYNATPADLTALGGPKNGWVADSLFYEIDIKTREIMFAWSALDSFSIAATKATLGTRGGDGSSAASAFDFFHLTSIQAVGEEAYLISSANLWACFLISRVSGEILWELNGSGKGGSFGGLPLEGHFRWQHHVRAYDVTRRSMKISLFDNHNVDTDLGATPSRGLRLGLQLPPDSDRPPVVHQDLRSSQPLFSAAHGSFQSGLSNGNQLLGFGPVPVVREHGPGDGAGDDIRWEGRFGHDDYAESYRAYKLPWRATPRHWNPALKVEKTGPYLRGFVSWNGATDIEAWNVYHVERGVTMRQIGRAMPQGFETEIFVPEAFNRTFCMIVGAVKGGEEVRLSNTACV